MKNIIIIAEVLKNNLSWDFQRIRNSKKNH